MQPSHLQAVLVLVPVLVLAHTTAAAEVYKWTDTDGNVHYGDRPPATGVDPHSIPLRPAPAKEADHAQRRLKQRRLLEAFEAESAEREQAEVEAAAARRERARNCEYARRDLARFERASIIYTVDENGARIYLSDQERRDAAANARAWIGKHCD